MNGLENSLKRIPNTEKPRNKKFTKKNLGTQFFAFKRKKLF